MLIWRGYNLVYFITADAKPFPCQCSSKGLGDLTKLTDALPFHTLCYMIEEPMNEGSLLLLTRTGLFRSNLFGDVEEIMAWPTNHK